MGGIACIRRRDTGFADPVAFVPVGTLSEMFGDLPGTSAAPYA